LSVGLFPGGLPVELQGQVWLNINDTDWVSFRLAGPIIIAWRKWSYEIVRMAFLYGTGIKGNQ